MSHPSSPASGGHRVSPGRFYPLGATLTGDGVNFAVWSQHARAVWLELFDAPDGPPTARIPLQGPTRFVWHAHVAGLAAGQLYGLRVAGPHDPQHGLRFNEHKLLLDPWARALSGKADGPGQLRLGYDPGAGPERDLTFDDQDSAAAVPKGVVVDDAFDWQGDAPPDLPLERLVIYEVHVKGFTAHPSSGVSHPGTYRGFIEKIPHLQRLGINAVELLPVHEFHVDDFLRERGLTNYWGYNTLNFFAPESSYAADRRPGGAVREFKQLVRALHQAGIEVILDVVYNHTAEGNELGPTISLKGLDNPVYYSLCGLPTAPGRYYLNHTGCGNSLNLCHPQTIRLVLDSLRYWVEVMHVDGFRFDLASVLGREASGYASTASFFDVISQDPVLARVKLIAEPWDLGSYEVGNFPVDWSEWNGRFRDTVRRFVKGDPGLVPDLGWRLTGSADLYADDGRSAFNSVNFITCHDGFTLWDLVCYDRKHNEANLEGNRDGANDNHSASYGVEGPSADPALDALRRRQVKNCACLLLCSLGTPMLLGGDELLRTQRGNNNAYCQDNEISWFDWASAEREQETVEFFRRAIAFNRRHTILHRRRFHTGVDRDGNARPDIRWLGERLGPPAWGDPGLRMLSCVLDGNEESSSLGDYQLLLSFNADPGSQWLDLPALPAGQRWYRVADTSLPAGDDFAEPGDEVPLDPDDHYLVNGRSVLILLGK